MQECQGRVVTPDLAIEHGTVGRLNRSAAATGPRFGPRINPRINPGFDQLETAQPDLPIFRPLRLFDRLRPSQRERATGNQQLLRPR